MRELCQTHKLAIAPDGKCVLCRRPSLRLFTVRQEHETAISRVFTGLLGVALVAAASALAYASLLDGGYTGGRYVDAPAPLGKLTTSAPAPKPPQPQTPANAKPANAKPANAAAPTTRAEPRQPVAVTMYATPWCDICDRAREFLLARGAVLTEYDIDSDRTAERRLGKLNPGASVPTFEIAGRAYVGFNPWDLEDAMRAAARPEGAATATAAKTRAP